MLVCKILDWSFNVDYDTVFTCFKWRWEHRLLFLEKEKASRWRTFIEADEKEVISGFSAVVVSAIPSRETMTLIEKFVCQLGI